MFYILCTILLLAVIAFVATRRMARSSSVNNRNSAEISHRYSVPKGDLISTITRAAVNLNWEVYYINLRFGTTKALTQKSFFGQREHITVHLNFLEHEQVEIQVISDSHRMIDFGRSHRNVRAFHQDLDRLLDE